MRDALPMPDVPTTVPNGLGSHVTAIAAFGVSLMGYIPYLFAALPAIYYLILIWESKTVQDWVARRRARKAARNLAKAKATAIVVAAKGDANSVVADAAVVVAKDEIKSIPPKASA